MAVRDFIALNKASVQSGLTTAQEQQQYRATHDIRKKDDSDRTASKSTPKFDEEMVFGISTRYWYSCTCYVSNTRWGTFGTTYM